MKEKKYLRKQWWYNFIYTTVLGIVGFLFELLFVLKIIPSEVLLKYSTSTIIIISLLQSVVVISIFAAIGTTLTRRIGFKTIFDEISSTKNSLWMILRRQLFYGVPIGISGAIIAYLIAPDFIAYLNSVPQFTRIFGSIYEEIIIRWGIMTLIVWLLWRIGQKGVGVPKNSLIWSGIILSQILFAFGHTYILINFGITNPFWSIATIFFATLPWGWLFWKRGIEAAIFAHMSFHISVILLVAMKI